jgi:uroporphyrinogen decarboxylase
MSQRDSLREILHFGNPAEVCQFEWGYWPETVERWRSEGLPADQEPWEAVNIATYDRAPVEARFCPAFEEEVISESETSLVVRDSDGVIKEIGRNHSAFPRFIEHPVRNMADFEKLKERLDPDSPARFPNDWEKAAAEIAANDDILVMGRLDISFFGWHRDLMGVENLLMAFFDQPELVHAISRHHLDFLKRFYGKILERVDYDFIFMWEDMSYKNGPLISPALIREFMLPYYRDLISYFKSIRDYKVLVDSDGDVNQLIPLFHSVGVDGMLPFECAAGMDIRRIRDEYPDLIIAGGIDKREIAKGKHAIDKELESKLPYMFERGGYLPSMDHHVPPEVSFEDFVYYIEKTRQIYKACHPR